MSSSRFQVAPRHYPNTPGGQKTYEKHEKAWWNQWRLTSQPIEKARTIEICKAAMCASAANSNVTTEEIQVVKDRILYGKPFPLRSGSAFLMDIPHGVSVCGICWQVHGPQEDELRHSEKYMPPTLEVFQRYLWWNVFSETDRIAHIEGWLVARNNLGKAEHVFYGLNKPLDIQEHNLAFVEQFYIETGLRDPRQNETRNAYANVTVQYSNEIDKRVDWRGVERVTIESAKSQLTNALVPEYETDLKEAKERNAALKLELATSDGHNKRLISELATEKGVNAGLAAELATKAKAAEALAVELSTMKMENRRLTNDLTSAHQRNETIVSQLHVASSQMIASAQRHCALASELLESKSKRKEAETERDLLRGTSEMTVADLRACERELSLETKGRSELEARVESMLEERNAKRRNLTDNAKDAPQEGDDDDMSEAADRQIKGTRRQVFQGSTRSRW